MEGRERRNPNPAATGIGASNDQTEQQQINSKDNPSHSANQAPKAITKQLGPHTFGVFVRDKGVISRVATMSDVGAAHAAAAGLNAIFAEAA